MPDFKEIAIGVADRSDRRAAAGYPSLQYVALVDDVMAALSQAYEEGLMCQADLSAKGEPVSQAAPALQSGDGGEAEERILRLKAEIRRLHRENDDLRASGDDEKLMLVRLMNDADVEAMDRAQLLQKIATLEAKYRFADLDGCITVYLRNAAKETFAGNCAFADDDLKLLTFCARWALENGIPDDLCPNVFPKAKARLRGEQYMPATNAAAKEAFVTKALDRAEAASSQSPDEEPQRGDTGTAEEREASLTHKITQEDGNG